jgi:hypothetical protein
VDDHENDHDHLSLLLWGTAAGRGKASLSEVAATAPPTPPTPANDTKSK